MRLNIMDYYYIRWYFEILPLHIDGTEVSRMCIWYRYIQTHIVSIQMIFTIPYACPIYDGYIKLVAILIDTYIYSFKSSILAGWVFFYGNKLRQQRLQSVIH